MTRQVCEGRDAACAAAKPTTQLWLCIAPGWWRCARVAMCKRDTVLRQSIKRELLSPWLSGKGTLPACFVVDYSLHLSAQPPAHSGGCRKRGSRNSLPWLYLVRQVQQPHAVRPVFSPPTFSRMREGFELLMVASGLKKKAHNGQLLGTAYRACLRACSCAMVAMPDATACASARISAARSASYRLPDWLVKQFLSCASVTPGKAAIVSNVSIKPETLHMPMPFGSLSRPCAAP